MRDGIAVRTERVLARFERTRRAEQARHLTAEPGRTPRLAEANLGTPPQQMSQTLALFDVGQVSGIVGQEAIALEHAGKVCAQDALDDRV